MFPWHVQLLCAITLLDATPPATGNTGSAATPPVAVKHVEAMTVVCLEHAGPYWLLGPPIAQIREVMNRRRDAGPVMVRFSADPTAVSPKSVQTLVCFVTSKNEPVEAPFRLENWESGDVAASLVDSAPGVTTRSYSAIREWIREQGHEAIGPIAEIYPTAPRGAASQVEIQLPIRKVAPPSVPRPPVHASAARSDLPSVPTRSEPAAPIDEMIAAGRFDQVAEQLMPADRRLDPKFQLWLGQVVFRIGAVAKGLQQQHGEAAAPVVKLADALVTRYKAASGAAASEPLSQAVVRVDPTQDPLAARKREIMRDLDSLLGRVATKAADPQVAITQLEKVIQQIHELQAPKP